LCEIGDAPDDVMSEKCPLPTALIRGTLFDDGLAIP
jgi:hypothetical protein